MELFVIFALGKAPTMDAWQRELEARRIPLQFTEKVDISEHSGFLAATVGGHKSGLFFLIENYAELASNYPVIGQLGLQQPVVYSLGYGGDLYECACAFYSASALVSAFGAKAFEPQGGVFMGSKSCSQPRRSVMSWQGLNKVFGAKRRPDKRLEATCETHAPQAWR
jgi:hypothetical protein